MQDTEPPRRGPRSALAPSVVFYGGLLLAGWGVLMLVLGALNARTLVLDDPHHSEANDTSTLAYQTAFGWYFEGHLEVSYRFPAEPGRAMLLSCDDYRRVREGRPPLDPLQEFPPAQEGSFKVALHRIYPTYEAPLRLAPGAPFQEPAPPRPPFCPLSYVVLQWESRNDSAANMPVATVVMRHTPLDSPLAGVALFFAAVGTCVAAVGGAWWSRRRGERGAPEPTDDLGTAETLLRLTERSAAWLQRTRRLLLLAGVLGIFLWYPVLLPWAWTLGRRGSDQPWMPIVLAGLALLLLGVLTALWARELLRLDRELRLWRERLATLRRREQAFLDEMSEP